MRARCMLTLAALLTAASLSYADGAAPVDSPRLLDTPGNRRSTATAINNFGHVVGFYENVDPETWDSQTRSFFWSQRAGVIDLGTVGGYWTRAVDINDRDEVVGWSRMSDGSRRAFLWTPWDGMVDIGAPSGFVPTAINNLGDMVGQMGMATLRTRDGRFVSLGTLGGPDSGALDINDRGQVVGWSATDGPYSPRHPFVWSAETGMVDLHEFGPVAAGAARINNHGQVAIYTYPDDFQSEVFISTPSQGTVMLQPYPGGFINGTNYGSIYGLNDIGQVVASTTYPGDEITRQLLWTGGGGPFEVSDGWSQTYTSMGINDLGEIAGGEHDATRSRRVAAIWLTALTPEECVDSLRALVEGLVLRHAISARDATKLTRTLKRGTTLAPFAKRVGVLVRSGRLSPRDGWLLDRAILLAKSR
jgi:probable HAF family extracellular repeat protein